MNKQNKEVNVMMTQQYKKYSKFFKFKFHILNYSTQDFKKTYFQKFKVANECYKKSA